MASKKRKRYIVGVDIGGTNIVAGAMSEDGSEHYGMRSVPTSPDLGAESVADRIVGLVEGVILDTMAATDAHRRDFIGVGVGAPGPMDRERGVVIVAPNLGWRDFPRGADHQLHRRRPARRARSAQGDVNGRVVAGNSRA